MAVSHQSEPKTRTAEKTGSAARLWHPRMWDGMNVTAFFRLLIRSRLVISPSRVGLAFVVGVLSVMNSCTWLVQSLILGRKIGRTKIEQEPIFILGHWRSGTTLLHEYLVLDRRHTYPDTFACFCPNHFLVSRYLIPWWLRFLMPAHRPMDNMKVGWKRPQEDEFALCNMGLPSPYLSFALPNQPLNDPEYLDLKGVQPKALDHWKRKFDWFLKCLTVQNAKRIVLKSPAHTCRVEVLLQLFPKARFVHIVRDPYALFPSTVRLWQRLSMDQGLQVPTFEGLEEQVLTIFEQMYQVFEEDRQLIDPSRFSEVRYEDLVADPVGQMERVYEELSLDGFDDVRPLLEERVAASADYKANRHQLAPEMRQAVSTRWAGYFEKYGYPLESTDPGEAGV